MISLIDDTPLEGVIVNLPILRCGVYVLYASELTVYVGRSYSDAYGRISAAVEKFSGRYELTHIHFYACCDREEVKQLEAKLIYDNQPPGNKYLKAAIPAHYRQRDQEDDQE